MRLLVLLPIVVGIACSPGATTEDSSPNDTNDSVDTGDGTSDSDDDSDSGADTDDSAVPEEVCDGIDNDGDGRIDEDFDQDGDGYLVATPECEALGNPVDCNDGAASIHPGAIDVCDGIDNDCSGSIDDAVDFDGDGYSACVDCNDDDATIHPDAFDACDAIDNDCDGFADEDFDEDGDGVSPCAGDCDDRDPEVSPLLPEICNGYDDDCDGFADNGFDDDADGYSTCEGDCDDTNADVHPLATEICDSLDDDCDGDIPDTTDADGDGYSLCEGDCDPDDGDVNPAATESCNDIDDDCDGGIDNLPECYSCTESGSYYLCIERSTWTDALAVCEIFGGTLAKIDSSSENTTLGSAVASLSVARFWIGLSDADVEGTFVWTDGSSASYTSWNSGEPASSDTSQNCVYMLENGAWYDERCEQVFGFICEF
jgi:hypothetical protein